MIFKKNFKFAKFDLSTLAQPPTIVGWGSTTTGGNLIKPFFVVADADTK
jgi:hypothetical protein